VTAFSLDGWVNGRRTNPEHPQALFALVNMREAMATPEPSDGSPQPAPDSTAGGHANLNTSISLLQRVRGRDQEAWRRLFYLYHPLVLYWCSRWGVLRDNADDVAQEVFQMVAGSLDAFRRDRPVDTFRGWLRGVTFNVLRMHLRRVRRDLPAVGGSDVQERLQQISAPPIDDDDPADQIGELHRRGIELVRNEFEERTWQMFWLTVIEGRSPAAVAVEMEVTPAAVRKAKSRVLHRLKEEVGDLLQ
jgi:RNA polymerase sigma-70 factor, ECF subfamily